MKNCYMTNIVHNFFKIIYYYYNSTDVYGCPTLSYVWQLGKLGRRGGIHAEHNLASKEHWVPKKYGPRVRHDISEFRVLQSAEAADCCHVSCHV